MIIPSFLRKLVHWMCIECVLICAHVFALFLGFVLFCLLVGCMYTVCATDKKVFVWRWHFVCFFVTRRLCVSDAITFNYNFEKCVDTAWLPALCQMQRTEHCKQLRLARFAARGYFIRQLVDEIDNETAT